MPESADARKERLAAMRAEAAGTQTTETEVVVKLRNYVPYDASLQGGGQDDAEGASSDGAGEGHRAKRRRGDDKAAAATDTKTKSKKSDKGTDLMRMELDKATTAEGAPVIAHKIDHDLKLQAADKLNKLQKRTQRAIVDILRQKLVNGEE